MNGLSRETRLQIMLNEEELAAIDDWRFKQRMPSRAAAIRQLLNIALRVQQKDSEGKTDEISRLRALRRRRVE